MLRPLSRNIPVVDDNGRPLQSLLVLSEQINKNAPIYGEGSPEGLIENAVFYIRQDGPPWFYVKALSDISGDRKMGWKEIA